MGKSVVASYDIYIWLINYTRVPFSFHGISFNTTLFLEFRSVLNYEKYAGFFTAKQISVYILMESSLEFRYVSEIQAIFMALDPA